ncbi:MAG: hypothetical protein OEY89_12725, partial [Gammaproteobacteria bacterium]|nr:hypothetical protein [Gammaproteobacteria bacterium]
KDSLLLFATRISKNKRITKAEAASIIHKTAHTQGININKSVIRYGWLRGKKPKVTETSFQLFRLFDDMFKCGKKFLNKLEIKAETVITPRKSYPRVEIPENIKRQLDEYILFRTKGILPDRDIVFKKDNKIDKTFRRMPKGARQWSLDINEHSETAANFTTKFQSFFNYIAHKKKNRIKDIDISILFDIDIMNSYVSDCIKREVYSSALNFLKLIKFEFRIKSYLSRYHAPINSLSKWKEEIKEIEDNTNECIDDITSIKRIGIDGKRNIEFILTDSTRIEMIQDIQKGLDRLTSLNTYGNYLCWCKQRSAFIFKIATEGMCPLRIKNFINLKWLGESTWSIVNNKKESGLYYDTDNHCYSICIPKIALKNRGGKQIDGIHRKLPITFNSYIDNMLVIREKYMTTKHGIKAASKFGNDSLLLLNPKNKDTSFSNHTLKVIQNLWPEKNILTGINPHSLRHLVASIYLMHNPENYTALATLLNDKLETVINVYAKRDDIGNAIKLKSFGEDIFGGDICKAVY